MPLGQGFLYFFFLLFVSLFVWICFLNLCVCVLIFFFLLSVIEVSEVKDWNCSGFKEAENSNLALAPFVNMKVKLQGWYCPIKSGETV